MWYAFSMGMGPSRIGDFRLNDAIGEGSTARVFDATHIATGQKVALKILEAGARSSSELKERLAREAVMLAEVTSLHVGRILGLGYDEDQPFLVLERLHGETFHEFMKREGSPTTSQLLTWIEQLLIGLRDCHKVGIVHRDIKPSNIFLQQGAGANPSPDDAFVKLIDFGVARLREIASVGVSLTSTNHLIGSMGYMAPEQLQYAKGVGPQADLYAVGVVLFRAISGKLPFANRSLEKVIKMKCDEDAPVLSSLPHVVKLPLLDAFCARALARTAEARFQTAGEMLEEWWRVTATIDADSPLTIEGMEFSTETDPHEATRTNAETLTLTAPGHAVLLADPDEEPPTRKFPPADSTYGVSGDLRTSPDNTILKVLQNEIQLNRMRKKGSEG